jgi:sulfocyanin
MKRYRGIPQMFAGAALVALATAGSARPPAGLAAAGALPAWVKVDAAHKSVSLKMTASFNGVNGTLNFNGYANGQMTVTVPVGWRVHVDLFNAGAGALPHSLEVIHAVPASKLPSQGIAPAIPNAESRDLIAGVPPLQSDSFGFTAKPPGQYLWLCGVPPHGVQGMWDRFVVSSSATAPSVTVK